MAMDIFRDGDGSVIEVRIMGILQRSEFSESERLFKSLIEAGERPLLLVVLEGFEGWQKDEGWDNLDFMFSHGDRIAKIAIVGAAEKEAEVRAFTGAGMRPTPVEFFDGDQMEQARAWLVA